MGDVGFKIGRKIKDLNGFERASVERGGGQIEYFFYSSQNVVVGRANLLLDTDTTSNAELFRDECFFVCGCDFDTELSHLDYRT
jgi:hypothetical protein